jgi:hypothetical protein
VSVLRCDVDIIRACIVVVQPHPSSAVVTTATSRGDDDKLSLYALVAEWTSVVWTVLTTESIPSPNKRVGGARVEGLSAHLGNRSGDVKGVTCPEGCLV